MHTLTVVTYKCRHVEIGCNSVAEHMISMYDILALFPSAIKINVHYIEQIDKYNAWFIHMHTYKHTYACIYDINATE